MSLALIAGKMVQNKPQLLTDSDFILHTFLKEVALTKKVTTVEPLLNGHQWDSIYRVENSYSVWDSGKCPMLRGVFKRGSTVPRIHN